MNLKHLFFIAFFSIPTALHASELNLLIWEEYYSPEALAAFTKESGIAVKVQSFDSGAARDVFMARSGGHGFDVIQISDEVLDSYVAMKWIQAIDKAAVSNLEHIDPRWTQLTQFSASHAVPYFWGTLGIAWRSDRISTPPMSWKALLDVSKDYAGRVMMIDSPRDLLAIALLAAGSKMLNDPSDDEIAAATSLLHLQSPYVKRYDYPTMDSESELVSGKIDISVMYSGDVEYLSVFQPALRYHLPEEGTVIWADYLSVAAKSVNSDQALQFINFMNRPDIAAINAQHVRYASPNRAALALMPAEYLENPVIFPSANQLESAKFHGSLKPEQLRILQQAYFDVTQGKR